MNLLDLLISPAYAQAAPAAAPGGFGSMNIILLVVMIGAMYFLMIRPQMKRAKEHKEMLGNLAIGDEVLTSGGVAGTVSAIGDHFVTVQIADNVQVRVQKGAVANVLPKGTLKSA